jgi:hypothetical protein
MHWLHILNGKSPIRIRNEENVGKKLKEKENNSSVKGRG